MSIKWLLGNNLNNFFSEVGLYDSSLWDRSIPILKHNIQGKDKLSFNKGYVTGRQKLDLYITPIRNFPCNMSNMMFSCKIFINNQTQEYSIPYSLNGANAYF